MIELRRFFPLPQNGRSTQIRQLLRAASDIRERAPAESHRRRRTAASYKTTSIYILHITNLSMMKFLFDARILSPRQEMRQAETDIFANLKQTILRNIDCPEQTFMIK
jgi:hypothetical protein